MSKIKVLVVDDSAFMRKIITDMLESDQQLEVIGTARNGRDALQKVGALHPDVITLDVEMPEMDGLETLQRIQEAKRTPVIMLSSTTTAGAENTMIALEKGAFDFVSKPSGPISLDLHKVKDELIEKVKLAYQHYQRLNHRFGSINKMLSKQDSETPKPKADPSTSSKRPTFLQSAMPMQPSALKLENGTDKDQHPLEKSGLANTAKPYPYKTKTTATPVILIGTSTGGPKALHQLFTSLPKVEQAAILIVQHMPPGFTKSLANRLDQQTEHRVVEARHEEVMQAGYVYIAPGGYHMTLKNDVQRHQVSIQLNEEPPRGGHRPSVNVLFESAIGLTNTALMAIVMTGMGKDGTEGLIKLSKTQNVYVLAEDESSCVVYGMPRAVVEANLAHEVCPLDEIHTAIFRWLNR